MKLFRLAVLYTALAFGANAASADIAQIEALRDGQMKKLTFHSAPKPVADVELVDAEGAPHRLSEYNGKYVVLNFWATWCAPCRHEMPSLDRLQAELGSDNFAVVPVATGHNPVPGIKRFFETAEIQNLPILRDPKQEMARHMAVLGLPITVILNPEGQEIARLRGDAEWDSDSAKAILRALMAES